MKDLLNKINNVLKQKPLIYFSREAERATGLEEHLTNYHICCIEDSSVVDELLKKGISVFCLEREGVVLENKATNQLLSDPMTITWIQSKTKGKEFFGLTLFPSSVVSYKVEQLGGQLLNNKHDFYNFFEDKIISQKFFSDNNFSYPLSFPEQIERWDYEDIVKRLGKKFVIQLNRGHTGSGTFIVKNKAEFAEVKKKWAGNIVKFSEFVDGNTFTLNMCIYNQKVYIGSVQYQITGQKSLTSNSSATVGNDFSYAGKRMFEDEVFSKAVEENAQKIGEALMQSDYKGLFGIDFIYKNDKFLLIEINARQTANIPFQTQLELKQYPDQPPMQLLHLAEFLGIQQEVHFESLKKLEGSQVFLRAKKDATVIDCELKSGIYKLLSDNSSKNFDNSEVTTKENVIYIDEDQDKPLIFQKATYKLTNDEKEFLILFQRAGIKKDELEEIARMQFNYQIVYNGTVTPWIIEALRAIRKIITNDL